MLYERHIYQNSFYFHLSMYDLIKNGNNANKEPYVQYKQSQYSYLYLS